MKNVFEGVKEVYSQFYQDKDGWLIEEKFFCNGELQSPEKFREKMGLMEQELQFMFS